MNAPGNVERRGIALVIVLGFLAVMIVMAVAFSVAMRTERLASAAAEDATHVRHLLHSALMRAMQDIDTELSGAGPSPDYFAPPKDLSIIWAVSSQPSPLKLGPETALLSGEVTNWLPRKYLSSADSDYDGFRAAEEEAEWVIVTNPSSGEILGRYSYLSFDCSGMIDANTLRSDGPLHVKYLADLANPNPAPLFQNLSNYTRFATFPEILFLNDGDAGDILPYEAFAINGAKLNNLMPFSYCYDKGWWDSASDRWQTNADLGLGMNINSWTGAVSMETVDGFLEEVLEMPAGLTPPVMPSEIRDNLLDYLDGDSIPRNLASFATEATPMINEIQIASSMTRSGTTTTHTITMTVETWYPFPGNPNEKPYAFTPPAFTVRNAASGIGFLYQGWPAATSLFPAVGTAAQVVPASITVTAGFQETRFLWETTADNIPPGRRFAFEPFVERLQLREGSGGGIVDLVTMGNMSIARQTIFSPGPGATTESRPVGANVSVYDPRLNYSVMHWTREPNGTMGTTNEQTLIKGRDEGFDMYVRNGAMSNVAELGFICKGDDWTTIEMYEEEGYELLRRLRTHDLPVETNGLINVNTQSTNVLHVVFRDMPVERYPGDSAPPKKFDDQSMVNFLVSEMVASAGSYDSAAGWVTNSTLSGGGVLSTVGYNNNNREALIRQAHPLFNANQNLFTIIVVAQTLNDQGNIGTYSDEDDVITGERRAVAVVWRDPFPQNPDESPDRRHRLFVRLFRYLDE